MDKETRSWKSRAEALWQILDDIDTLSDAIRPSDLGGYRAFYEAAMKMAVKRNEILESLDGYTLSVPKEEGT